MSYSAFVALGSNMPWNGVSGPALLAQALTVLGAAGLPIRSRSSVWQTAAWPAGSEQDDYCNAVVELIPGQRSPQQLYDALCAVERAFGRERRERWAARTLDLDIVAMDGAVGEFGAITLPHPRMHERAFVLGPLAEIAPAWVHPALGVSVTQLLAALPEARLTKLGDLRGTNDG